MSTERQAERGTIGSQLQLLREHIVAAGDELVGEYVDDGHSGARLDRPGLDALRDAAEAGLLERVWMGELVGEAVATTGERLLPGSALLRIDTRPG